MKFDELKEKFDKIQTQDIYAHKLDYMDMLTVDNQTMIKHIIEYLEAKEKNYQKALAELNEVVVEEIKSGGCISDETIEEMAKTDYSLSRLFTNKEKKDNQK